MSDPMMRRSWVVIVPPAVLALVWAIDAPAWAVIVCAAATVVTVAAMVAGRVSRARIRAGAR